MIPLTVSSLALYYINFKNSREFRIIVLKYIIQ